MAIDYVQQRLQPERSFLGDEMDTSLFSSSPESIRSDVTTPYEKSYGYHTGKKLLPHTPHSPSARYGQHTTSQQQQLAAPTTPMSLSGSSEVPMLDSSPMSSSSLDSASKAPIGLGLTGVPMTGYGYASQPSPSTRLSKIRQPLPKMPSRSVLRETQQKTPASSLPGSAPTAYTPRMNDVPMSAVVAEQRNALMANAPAPTPRANAPAPPLFNRTNTAPKKPTTPRKLNIEVPQANANVTPGPASAPPPSQNNASSAKKEKEQLSAQRLVGYPLHPLFAAQYIIHEELGAGGFGFVVRASRRSDGLPVAVKFILRKKIPAHGWVRSRSWGNPPGLKPCVNGERLVPLEAYILKHMNHPNIVRFIDMFEDDTYMYMIMEHHGSPWQGRKQPKDDKINKPSPVAGKPLTPPLSPLMPTSPLATTPTPDASFDKSGNSSFLSVDSSGLLTPSPQLSPVPSTTPAQQMEKRSYDLFECIEQMGRLPEKEARFIFSQIVEAVYALDRRGICHRDIKDENIVIDSNYRVKLIDFGSAVIYEPGNPPFYTSFFGTTSFASAEILRGESYQPPSSEVWSLGVLLTVLVTGGCPFADPSAASVGRRARIPSSIQLSRPVLDLISRCLELDISKRITISEIRRHPWMLM